MKQQWKIAGLAAVLLCAAPSVAVAEYDSVAQVISGEACDARHGDDGAQTAENRALDKASMAAVKTSGVLQKYQPNLSAQALDLISYRVIDEHLQDVSHEVTLNDSGRICVKMRATMVLAPDDMAVLLKEYIDSDAPNDNMQLAEVAEKIENTMYLKPQTLQDKKLLYIYPLTFWNGTETNHYGEYLHELFADSEYFFVTDDAAMADYTVMPRLVKAEVDEIDSQNHKMQMLVEVDTEARNMPDFTPLSEQQNHFILFGADKDEQEIADTLVKKLLHRAVSTTTAKINKHIQNSLENSKIRSK